MALPAVSLVALIMMFSTRSAFVDVGSLGRTGGSGVSSSLRIFVVFLASLVAGFEERHFSSRRSRNGVRNVPQTMARYAGSVQTERQGGRVELLIGGVPGEKTREPDKPMGMPCPLCGKRWYRVEAQDGEVVCAMITATPCNRCRRAGRAPVILGP